MKMDIYLLKNIINNNSSLDESKDSDNKYLEKNYKNPNIMNTTNPNIQKTELIYILYRIPYKVNEYDLIRNFHDEINHRC